ncbi:MAG: hypothetical protein E7672_02545 [Ruminococcaceae bacterium]|nr:hypothetical protein [Oscillospiraceae bacterium]
MKQNRRPTLKKLYILLFSLAVLLIGTVGGTVAYLVREGGAAAGIFDKAVVSCEVTENSAGDAVIRNTGDTDVFVRAFILVNWKDEAGNVYSHSPKKDIDYSIEYSSDKWFADENGFVYYAEELAPGDEVILCSSAQLLTELPEGYDLVTEIYAEAIQSEPADAVFESWNLTAADGKISR